MQPELAKLGLSASQLQLYLHKIAWRRATIIAQRGNFPEKFPEDPITCFLMSGKQYFDREILVARKLELVSFKPYKSFENGAAKLFHPAIATRRYLLAGDPATGRQISKEDTDFAAGVVLDLETGEEMASYRARVTPEDFAYDLADLGRYYNNAVIAIERTGDGGTTILTLNGECRYPSVYRHKEWWKRGRQTKVVDFEGFPTTQKTRPVALNFLNHFIMESPQLIWDSQFVDEALVFVRDEKGRPAAAVGAHDDTVSARWVAHFVRRVLLGWFDPLAKMARQGYVSSDRLEEVEV